MHFCATCVAVYLQLQILVCYVLFYGAILCYFYAEIIEEDEDIDANNISSGASNYREIKTGIYNFVMYSHRISAMEFAYFTVLCPPVKNATNYIAQGSR